MMTLLHHATALAATPRWASTLAALLAAGTMLCAGPARAAAESSCKPVDWPLWNDFRTHFVQKDGRIVDASTPKLHSSSESQSYGMFFALVANDQEEFERMWRWSVNNLAGGNMRQRLPAWIWGLDEDGRWRVLDENSASDADLWFAYALAEASRLWQRPDYLEDARALLALVESQEIAALPGLGPMLLPGRHGFAQPDGLWRLNPSYLPLPVLRLLATVSPKGPWPEVANNTVTMIERSSPRGVAADWLAYRSWGKNQGDFAADPVKGDVGSYDAIRNYLWAGMTAPGDPLAQPLMNALPGMHAALRAHGHPPETFYVLSGGARGAGPAGFSAAVLPYLHAVGAQDLAGAQRQRTETLLRQSLAHAAATQHPPPYYDFVLALFGLGWDQQRYRFNEDGRLEPLWENTCPHAATR